MVRIGSLIYPLRVVEDGEQTDDLDVGSCFLGKPQAILCYSCPMSYTVGAPDGKLVFFKDCAQDKRNVDGHSVASMFTPALSSSFAVNASSVDQ